MTAVVPPAPACLAGRTGRGWRWPSGWLPGWWCLALLLVAGRYGFHGDEFYFVVTGRHLQVAAPDNPMLVPYLAAGWYGLVGGRLWAFRILAGVGSRVRYVLLGGLIAREFGAAPRHQLAAAGGGGHDGPDPGCRASVRDDDVRHGDDGRRAVVVGSGDAERAAAVDALDRRRSADRGGDGDQDLGRAAAGVLSARCRDLRSAEPPAQPAALGRRRDRAADGGSEPGLAGAARLPDASGRRQHRGRRFDVVDSTPRPGAERLAGRRPGGEHRVDRRSGRLVAIGAQGNRRVAGGGFLDLRRVPADHRRQGLLPGWARPGGVGRRCRAGAGLGGPRAAVAARAGGRA